MAEAEEKLEVEGCGFLCVHEKVVEKVQHELPQEETLLRLADLFKVFGDGTRVRILFVLLTAEVCVCDLAKLLGMTQSAVSHQLRVLKQARLIKARRGGKTVFYSLGRMTMWRRCCGRAWSMSARAAGENAGNNQSSA